MTEEPLTDRQMTVAIMAAILLAPAVANADSPDAARIQRLMAGSVAAAQALLTMAGEE